MSHEEIQALLRSSAVGVFLAVVLFTAGLASVAFFFSRWKVKDFTALLFGILSTLYGVRLFLETDVASLVLDLSSSSLTEIKEDITFVLLVPFGLFFAEIFHAQVKRQRWLWLWFIPLPLAIGAAGLLCNTLHRGEGITHAANHVYVIGTIVVITVVLITAFSKTKERSARSELLALAVGFACIGLFALHTNLRDYGVPGPSLEPFGFFIFVCSLGYVVMLRTTRNEEQLTIIRKELEIARQIQASILPRKMPILAGIELAGRYEPMTAVGGDFYDFLVVDDKRLGILVADVSGHGVPAALVASMVKVAVSTQSEHVASPAQMLRNLNQILQSNLQGQYVTAAYLFVDAEKGRLLYAGAGHPPLLLARSNGNEASFIEENGLMLGVFPQAEYTEVEIPWGPGDRCLLYTDGVVEAENQAQDSFGMERLQQRLQSVNSGSAAAIADSLLSDVTAWRGPRNREQQDDITMVVVQCTGCSYAAA